MVNLNNKITKQFLFQLGAIADSYKTLFEKATDLLIWLVGFAITAIGILAFNKQSISKDDYYEFPVYKSLFLGTIICGILYRLLYSYLSMFMKKMESYAKLYNDQVSNIGDIDHSILDFLNSIDLITIEKLLREKELVEKEELSIEIIINSIKRKIGFLDKVFFEVLVRMTIYQALKEKFSSVESIIKSIPIDTSKSFFHHTYSKQLRMATRKITTLIVLISILGFATIIQFVAALFLIFNV